MENKTKKLITTAFFFGLILGIIFFPRTKEKIVEKTVFSPSRSISACPTQQIAGVSAQMREFKTIDDQIITLAGKAIIISSNSIKYVGNGDNESFENSLKQIQEMTKELNVLADKRLKIIGEIGL